MGKPKMPFLCLSFSFFVAKGLPLCRLVYKMIYCGVCMQNLENESLFSYVCLWYCGYGTSCNLLANKKENYGNLHVGCSTQPTGKWIHNNPTYAMNLSLKSSKNL